MRSTQFSNSTNLLTYSNIRVTDPNGNPITNYNIYFADGEATGSDNAESQVWNTNGGPWQTIQIVGAGGTPVLSGVGTQTTTLTGVPAGFPYYNSPVLTSQIPTQVTAALTTDGARQAIVFGVSVTKIQLRKIINSRLLATDQFTLNITGSPSNSVTTSGNSTGLQPQTAYVYAPTNGTYNISEAMAAGSLGGLSDYTTTVSYSNLTPSGSAVPTGTTVPQDVTLADTDIIVATITNTAKIPPSRGVLFI